MAELSKADLDELVEEAIVDAYGEDEQMAGFYTMIEENLVLPFMTMSFIQKPLDDLASEAARIVIR
ncbi:MAG: calcium-binding protein [Trebonia sp.]